MIEKSEKSSWKTSVNFSRIFESEIREQKKCKNFYTQILVSEAY